MKTFRTFKCILAHLFCFSNLIFRSLSFDSSDWKIHKMDNRKLEYYRDILDLKANVLRIEKYNFTVRVLLQLHYKKTPKNVWIF